MRLKTRERKKDVARRLAREAILSGALDDDDLGDEPGAVDLMPEDDAAWVTVRVWVRLPIPPFNRGLHK